jgi:Helix-turn-helix domain
MARPEAEIEGEGPVQDLALALRRLRADAGTPTYRQMADESNYSVSVLAAAAGGKWCPTWDAVRAFTRACGADPQNWVGRWERARQAKTGVAAPARRPRPQPAPRLARRPASRPDPRQARTPGEYARQLRALRAWGGSSPEDIARAARGPKGQRSLPSSTLSDAMNSERTTLPKLWIVEAIVIASCRGDIQAFDEWVTAWQALAVEHQGHRDAQRGVRRLNQYRRGAARMGGSSRPGTRQELQQMMARGAEAAVYQPGA